MSEVHEALAALEGQSTINTMAEALSTAGDVKVAPPRIPDKAIVAVQLDRGDESVKKGSRMVSIDRDWLAAGMAVAIRRGHVVAANHIYGRWSAGMPKVTACHYVVCPACGRRTLEPLAVWEAKDIARKGGKDVDRHMAAADILAKWGSCPCGGKWAVDRAGEKAELTVFADKALRAMETMPEIPAFLPPATFAVTPDQTWKAPEEWAWLTAAMAAAGRGVSPYAKDAPNQGVIVYNPGFWLGFVDDPNSTELFWVEKGEGRRTVPVFNPGEVDGL